MAHGEYHETINFYTRDDPYYFEVDNRPLIELQDNTDWLKQQIDSALIDLTGKVNKLDMRGAISLPEARTNEFWMNLYNMLDVDAPSVIGAEANDVLVKGSSGPEGKWTAQPIGETQNTLISQLDDVSIAAPEEDDILTYNADTQKWENTPFEWEYEQITYVSRHGMYTNIFARDFQTRQLIMNGHVWPAGVTYHFNISEMARDSQNWQTDRFPNHDGDAHGPGAVSSVFSVTLQLIGADCNDDNGTSYLWVREIYGNIGGAWIYDGAPSIGNYWTEHWVPRWPQAEHGVIPFGYFRTAGGRGNYNNTGDIECPIYLANTWGASTSDFRTMDVFVSILNDGPDDLRVQGGMVWSGNWKTAEHRFTVRPG